MLGTEEEGGKIHWINVLQISERAVGSGVINPGTEEEKKMRLVEILAMKLKANKKKKKKKGKGKKKKKK